MEPCLSHANVSIGCWGEHDWEGWVADKLCASSNAKPEASTGLQMLCFMAFAA